MSTGHGVNLGHGYVKYLIIDAEGQELSPVVFPAVVARAGATVTGALTQVSTVHCGGEHWWAGSDALLSPNARTLLAQERLSDAQFVPILLRAALNQFGALNGAAAGFAVTGLPASWSTDLELAQQLGARMRAATDQYRAIRVIAEPLGLLYSLVLDAHGNLTGDPAWHHGTIAVVDLGHHTVDVAVLARMHPVPTSYNTFALGTARPLREIRALLSTAFQRELSLYETDLAVRAGHLRQHGAERPLPAGWDRPLRENGAAIAARLTEEWAGGAHFDALLLGGGGAAEPRLVEAITARFPHAVVVEQPQLAIARGYARLARRLGASA